MKNRKAEILLRICNDIQYFASLCLPSAVKKKIPPFHDKIYADLLNDELKFLLIAAPRGTAKSTLGSLVYVMWLLARKHAVKWLRANGYTVEVEDSVMEELYVILISEAQGQSKNFLSRIKYHLEISRPLRALVGDLGEDTARTWREDEIKLADGTRIVAVGTKQRIRGVISEDSRPSHVIVDDFESEQNAATEEAMYKNLKWVTEAVMPSMRSDGKMVVIGTVIHEECFLMKARADDIEDPELKGTWKVHWYQIVDEETGESIWPEEYPMARIEAIKNRYMRLTGSLNGFYQEYMNVPQNPDEAPFKSHYIHHHSYKYRYTAEHGSVLYKTLDDGHEEVVPVYVYLGIDPASSLSKTADYFVIMAVGVDEDWNRYVISIFRKREDPAFHVDRIFEYVDRYHPRKTVIETTGYQESLRANCRRRMRDEKRYIPGLENGYKPRQPKDARLESLVPLFAQGKVFLRHEDTIFESEILAYPKGKKDQLDAFWLAIQKSKKYNGAKFTRGKKKKRAETASDWKLMV
jgi:phage terminase large subunit-like protein